MIISKFTEVIFQTMIGCNFQQVVK